MDSRAADSLFGGTNDGHDFFTSLDGANTSPKQSVQQRAVEYPQSAPTNSHATAQYSSASPGSTTQANNTQDPYAQAVKHAQAVSTYDPYAPSYASHLTTAYQTTSSVPSHLPATPYAPHITPSATSSMTTAQAYDPYAPAAATRSAVTTPYMAPHSYNTTYTSAAATPGPYAPPPNMVPPPPAPKTVDASQFRVKPNAYDPPIRDAVPTRGVSRVSSASAYSTPHSPPVNYSHGPPAYAAPPPRTPSIPPPPVARMTPPPPMRPPSTSQPPKVIPPPPDRRNSFDLSSPVHTPATSTTSHLSTHVHGTQYVPRTSSPLVPRPVSGTGSPRPPSVASNKSVHSPPPRAPSVVSSTASQSRPSSAASNPYAPPPRSRTSVSSAGSVESSGRVSAKLPSPTSQAPPPALVPPLEIEEPLATARPDDGVNPFNVIPPSSENLASYKPTLGSTLSQTSPITNAMSLPPNLYHDESHTNVESKPEGRLMDPLEDPESAFGTGLGPQPSEVDELVEHEKERVQSPPLDPYALVKPVQSAPNPQFVVPDPYASVRSRQPTDPYAPTQNRQLTDPSHGHKTTDPYAIRQDPYSSASIVPGPPRRQTLEGVRTPPPPPTSVLDLTHSPPQRAVKPPIQVADPYRPTVPPVPQNGPYQLVSSPPTSTVAYQPLSNYQPMQPPLSTYQPTQPVPPPSQPVHEPPAEQYATVPSTLSTSQHNMYAPSPSLLGTNDPLGRTSLRVPVVSFGFGGKLVLCSHKNPAEVGGFDTAMSARPATQVSFKYLKEVVPSSIISAQTRAGTPFPGPLFCDQTPAAAGMLAGAAANTKAKKTALVQWLEESAAEAEREVGYVGNDSVVGRAKAEGRNVLIKLLKVLIENDGKLAGSPTIEAAVRTALLGAVSESFVAGDILAHGFAYQGAGAPSLGGHSTATVTYQVKTTSLDRLQELLIRGERRKAYQFASDEKMWAHALLIASNLDKSAWKEVVSEFIQAELGVLAGVDSPINAPSANKRESLRVAYGLIAGDSAAAVKQLVPPRLLGRGPHTSMLVPGRSISPTHTSAAPISVPVDALVQWKEVLSAIYSNHNAGDDAPLTALGDQLVAKQWIEAAHCCYLLASGLSSISGTACPAPRIALFGSEHPAQARYFHTDLLPVILSEVAEYGLSLAPPVKGQEPYPGLPHLQVYRLWHAACQAEIGDVSSALRYTEAINATLRMSTRASPYLTSTFLEQLKDLHDRLTGAPHGDKKNFLRGAITKPSMETFNTWIAGGLTKLIEGDDATPQPQDQQTEVRPANGATLGPFSHYSTISNAPSKSPSPAPSFTSVPGMSTIPPPRTASTGGYRPPANGLSPMPVAPPPDRSASAIDHIQMINRKPSPGPKDLSAPFLQAHENGYTPYNSDQMNSPSAEGTGKRGAEPETGTWWGSSNGGTASATPTAATFLRVNAGELSEGEGPQFISLGDSDTLFAPSATPSIAPSSPRYTTAPSSHDEDDDLGLGNSKPKKKKPVEGEDEPESTSSGPASAPPPLKADPRKEEAKPQDGPTSGGWFGWFRKSDAPKPVKANLGKESSFYYDPDLGRWVNKAADGGNTAPKAPPPPPRAQTASPGKSFTGAVSPATTTPPPPRAASVVPSNGGMAPPPPSSTLSGVNSRTSSTPPGPRPPSRLPTDAPPKAGTPPPPRIIGQTPPPGGPTTSGTAKAAKRNPRSRYVDVFQQQT